MMTIVRISDLTHIFILSPFKLKFFMFYPTILACDRLCYLKLQRVLLKFKMIHSVGTGCFVISVETAARRKAKVIGKPERYMFDCMKLW